MGEVVAEGVFGDDGWGSSVAVESNQALADTSYALDPGGTPRALTGGLYLADDGMGSVTSVLASVQRHRS